MSMDFDAVWECGGMGVWEGFSPPYPHTPTRRAKRLLEKCRVLWGSGQFFLRIRLCFHVEIAFLGKISWSTPSLCSCDAVPKPVSRRNDATSRMGLLESRIILIQTIRLIPDLVETLHATSLPTIRSTPRCQKYRRRPVRWGR